MTLNQIIKRIQTLSLSHKQVRSFYYGKPTDFIIDKKPEYTAVFLQEGGINISPLSKTTTYTFKLYVLDLMDLDQRTWENVQEVQSDSVSILEDLLALINQDSYSDWALGTNNATDALSEKFDDIVAGAVSNIEIRTPYLRDVCAVPTE